MGNDINLDLAEAANEHEKMFCGAVLADCLAVVSTCAWLSPDLFRNVKYREFWRRCLAGEESVAVSFDMEIAAELIVAMNHLPPFSAWPELAEKIAEYAYYRRSMRAVLDIVSKISERKIDDIKVIADNFANVPTRDGTPGSSATDIHKEFLDFLVNGKPPIKYYIPGIDNVLGGLFPELTVIAARPGMGKTSIVTQIGRNTVMNGGKVLFMSLEMARMQLWARMACPMAGLEWRNVRSKNVSKADLQKLEIESYVLEGKLRDRFIVYDDAYTLPEIYNATMKHKPDLVIIDQLPEIRWSDPREEPIVWYGKACKFIRDYIPRAMGIPVILVHQLSRKVEDRQDKRPALSDLRDSGEVEQIADAAVFLYRDDYYKGRMTGTTQVPCEFIVRKNRQGEMAATVTLIYDLKQQWFS